MMAKSVSKLILYTIHSDVQKHWQGCFDSLQVHSGYSSEIQQQQLNGQEFIVLFHLFDEKQQLHLLKKLIQPGRRVVVLVDEVKVEQGVRLFRQGIKGYVDAYASPELLLRAIHEISQGRVWLGQDIMAALIAQVNASEREEPLDVEASLADADLTARELDVAKGILAGQSNKEIAEHLFISERTVKAHVHSLFRKQQVKDRLAFVIQMRKRAGATSS